MSDTGRLRRRRDLLLDRHPYCCWCGCRVRYWKPDPSEYPLPDDFATLDHLNSRVQYPAGRPRQGHTVLSCKKCNEARAAEQIAARNRGELAVLPGPPEAVVRPVTRQRAALISALQEEEGQRRRRIAMDEEWAEPLDANPHLRMTLEEARRRLGLDRETA